MAGGAKSPCPFRETPIFCQPLGVVGARPVGPGRWIRLMWQAAKNQYSRESATKDQFSRNRIRFRRDPLPGIDGGRATSGCRAQDPYPPLLRPCGGFSGQTAARDRNAGGLSALIDAFDLEVPLPRRLRATGQRHRIRDYDRWRIMTPRHAPAPTLEGHLTFALKYEGLDLAVLKRLFLTVSTAPIEEIARARPTGSYARRVWFLFEWLTGRIWTCPTPRAAAMSRC